MTEPKTAPLVRNVMFQPFIEAVEAEGTSASDLLRRAGTSKELVIEQESSSVLVWYEFVEHCARDVGDPFFGYRVGRHSAMATLPNLQGITGTTMSLGDQINRMVSDAARIANLGRYTVLNDGRDTELRLTRRFRPIRPPRQIDGFGFGFFEQVLRSSLGAALDGTQLSVKLCDPTCVPGDAVAGCSLNAGDNMGAIYHFPSAWLGYALGRGPESTLPEIDTDFIISVRQIIRSNVSNTKLTSKVVAMLTGTSLRTFQARLKSSGTSFRRELARARTDEAHRLLTTSSLSVENIARAVGYEDASSFIRAFKSQTGETPSVRRRRTGG